MRKLYEWGHRQFPKFPDCRPILVKRSLEAAGFNILDAEMMSRWGLPIDIVLAMKITVRIMATKIMASTWAEQFV